MVCQTLLFGALLWLLLVADQLGVVQARHTIHFAEKGRKIGKDNVMGLGGNFHRRIVYINNLLSDKTFPKKTTSVAGKWIKYSIPLLLIGYFDYFIDGVGGMKSEPR